MTAITKFQDFRPRDQLRARHVSIGATLGIPLQSTDSPRQLTVKSPVNGRISTRNAVAGTWRRRSSPRRGYSSSEVTGFELAITF
jgi:hypothetical protein